MELEKKIRFCYNSQECEFRTLTVSDVTESYVQGLRNQREFLVNNPRGITVKKQQDYVRNVLLSDADTICGLFADGVLIGTTGVQNIRKHGLSTIGVFVLEKRLRSRGYGKTLIWAACYLVNTCCGVENFVGGMKKINIPAFKAFDSCGFKTVREEGDVRYLGLNIKDLIKPELVARFYIE